MAMKCCPNGHWYDNSKQKKCSICKNIKKPPRDDLINEGVRARQGGDIGGTVAGNNGGDINVTVPVNYGGDIGGTVAVTPGGDIGGTVAVTSGGDINATVPVRGRGDISETVPVTGDGYISADAPAPVSVPVRPIDRRPRSSDFIDSEHTVPVIYEKVDESYPVGFMVCIAGGLRGRDYKLRSGDNTIGRDADPRKFDITINDDNIISRETLIILNYNPGTNEYTLTGGNGAQAIVKRNNKPVMPTTSVVLSPYDKILIGKTKFMFLPLCGEDFVWGDQ
jgi:hypothetical protein